MPRLTMVRYTTRPEASDENERLSRRVFEQARANAPQDVAYALFRSGDEFIHLFANLTEDSSDSITETPSFHAFQADILARCVVPPQATRLSVDLVDSYGFAGR